MSLIVTVCTGHGIVMASDSRLTLKRDDGMVPTNDTAFKTFACPNGAGISICGDAVHENEIISAHINRMIEQRITEETPITKLPDIIWDYFGHNDPVNGGTSFFVAGYERTKKGPEARIYWLSTEKDLTLRCLHEVHKHGAFWSGECEVLKRLLSPVLISSSVKSIANFTIRESGKVKTLPKAYIADAATAKLYRKPTLPYAFYTLQDAVDFAEFAIETTASTMRFYAVPQTVGGPIDILIIEPTGCRWLRRKTLTAD